MPLVNALVLGNILEYIHEPHVATYQILGSNFDSVSLISTP